MSWLLRLSDWLSSGLLTKYQRQADSAKAKLSQAKLNIDNLKKQLHQSQKELEQIKAQLLIAKGFQAELGETQIKLKQASTKFYQCQQQLEEALSKSVKFEDWYQQLQTKVEVLAVKRLPQEDFDALWGFSIASPKANTKVQGGSITIRGWVLGKKALATTVRIDCQGQTLVETPVNLSRPRVTQNYPDIPAAGTSGFEIALSVVNIPAETELEVKAVLENQDIIALGIICLGH